MKTNNYTFITYGLLTLLIIFIYSISFKYKFKTAQQLSFRGFTNANSNKENFDNIKKKDSNIKSETKKILLNTKKICDLECAKCMMTMLSDNKSLKTIDLENILDDETDENCIKCKKYTELSTSIKSIIDNL